MYSDYNNGNNGQGAMFLGLMGCFFFLACAMGGSLDLFVKIMLPIMGIAGIVGIIVGIVALVRKIKTKEINLTRPTNPGLHRTIKKICRRGYVSAKDKEILSEHVPEIFSRYCYTDSDLEWRAVRKFQKKIQKGELKVSADDTLVQWFILNDNLKEYFRDHCSSSYWCHCCVNAETCMFQRWGPTKPIQYITEGKNEIKSPKVNKPEAPSKSAISISSVYLSKYMANMGR